MKAEIAVIGNIRLGMNTKLAKRQSYDIWSGLGDTMCCGKGRGSSEILGIHQTGTSFDTRRFHGRHQQEQLTTPNYIVTDCSHPTLRQ